MANEFVIKKGHSSRLFSIPQEQLVENGWYLTTDTAEVYVALRQETTQLLELKKINECDIDNDLNLESFEDRITALEKEEKVHTYGYRSMFPSESEAIAGHMYVAVDEKQSYVYFDGSYVSLSSSYEEPQIIYGGTAD